MNRLAQIYYSDPNLPTSPHVGANDKGTAHSYIEAYDELLYPYVDKNINLLEIGIQEGHSLTMWQKYLTPQSKITGIDVQLKCYVHERENIEVFIGDATDKEVVDRFFSSKKFDVIIDDGSHRIDHQLKSFSLLFENYLNDGGVYIIEDIDNLDRDKKYFMDLHSSCKILDRRSIKNRWDDVLIVYKK